MLPLEYITVGGLLRRTTALFPNRMAVIDREIKLTYREFDELTDRYATALLRQGVGRGDHVAMFGEAEAEVLALFFAIQRIGAVAVMVNTALVRTDLETVLRLGDPKLICIGASYQKDRDLAADVNALGSLPTVTEGVFTIGRTASAVYPPLRAEKQADENALAAAEKQVRCEDTAVIIFTSGSTGLPKPVMTSHFSRVNGGIQQANDFAATYEDVFCVAVPMFHCFTISTNIMASTAVGGCICLPDNRHTSSILRAIQQHRCTVLHAVPSMYRAIMARKDFADYDIGSLRVGIIGGASYPPNDFVRIEEGFGMTLASSLGQTESTAGLTVCSLDDSLEKRSTTIGHFMNHVEGKIADLETGEALAPGKVGEICIKGYLVMQGYYHQPEQTAKAIDADGWLHTGDLGELDEDGDIILRGRIKELINRGGEKISPVEVENEICALPQVDTCRMIPVPDVHYGEEACACVVLHENMSVSEEEIRSHLREQVAAYKIPKYILFFDRLPLNGTGKVDSAATAARARAELGIA